MLYAHKLLGIRVPRDDLDIARLAFEHTREQFADRFVCFPALGRCADANFQSITKNTRDGILLCARDCFDADADRVCMIRIGLDDCVGWLGHQTV